VRNRHWQTRRTVVNTHQQFRQDCDNVVREAFSQAKQRYGAPRLAEEVNLGPEVQCKNDSVQPAPSGSAAISVRNNLKTRTSLKAVSTIRGQDQNC
ncbi:hypothetical protein E3J01_23005, partial [Salmonella enterica]|nr:hypothetical protein [Salmonella enterica]